MGMWIRCGVPILLLVGGFAGSGRAQQQTAPPSSPEISKGREAIRRFVNLYCVECHNGDDKAGGLDLDAIGSEDVNRHPEAWEKVVRRLVARQMPPEGALRPKERTYDSVVSSLAGSLDRAAAEHPDPGRTDTFRRLNRTEYQNAIRDLLALDIDATALLPADESSHGFDNVTVGDLSPTLLDRYITAAQKISRLAVGSPGRSPGGDTFRIRADLTQEEHVEGLPLGTRGGALIPYTFPQDGEYEIQLRLARDRNEHVEGLREPHELEVLLDRERVASLTVTPPATEKEHQTADEHLKARIRVTAGPHQVGVTFLKDPSSLLETKRQPYQAHFNMHRHPRISPALYQVSITGPYHAGGHGDTPSRRRIFVCEPEEPGEEEACARRILSTLLRRAYRRPVTDADLEKPMEFYREARAEGDFDAGIEMALSAVLVNPQFLFRDRAGPARRRARHGLPHQRPRARVPPVVLPLEQHPRRRAARPGDPRRARQARGARAAGAPDAGRPPLAEPGDQLRGPVAAPAQPGIDHPGPAPVPRLRRQPAAGIPAGDGAPLRERPARGPQRARPPEVGLHLPERAPGQALRRSRTSTAAASVASRSTATASGAACSARGAS